MITITGLSDHDQRNTHKTAGIFEGKCYDNAAAGKIQMFQIRVHDRSDTDDIRRQLLKHLGERGLLRVSRE